MWRYLQLVNIALDEDVVVTGPYSAVADILALWCR
jgi:hypothetical protein